MDTQPLTFELESRPIKKCRAIVMFGLPGGFLGEKPATFFQVTIDPAKVSPNGEYIRFGFTEGDELVGWQKVSAMTICEILGEYNDDGTYPPSLDKPEPLEMRVIKE